MKSVSVHESLSLALTLLECLITFSVGVLDIPQKKGIYTMAKDTPEQCIYGSCYTLMVVGCFLLGEKKCSFCCIL